MAKIYSLKISNFKGFKNFEHVFGMTEFVCLIGRGDSGKTTILEAISLVLSPSWNIPFYDTDFFNCDVSNPIEIEASLYDLPQHLMLENKYGLYKRFLNKKGEIIDDIFDDELNCNSDILTVRLIVTKDLEPKWYVVNDRANQEPVEMKTNDRACINVFLVSDNFDRHFSWNKGTPLYSLLKAEDSTTGSNNIIIDAFRDAKKKIDHTAFNHLESVVEKIKVSSLELGVDISNTNTTIDFKDISIKDGRICLHDNSIPFRLKGKGSKRLISIAIQTELVNEGGILLIDEIEQGLEPDRAQHLAQILKKKNKGQIFITTHSSNVLVELDSVDIYKVKKDKSGIQSFDKDLQGCLRNNPEAFFAKKVLVCEGATEVGICKAINNYMISKGLNSFSLLGIGIVDGTGNKFVTYCENFKKTGVETCAFCDSDDKPINKKKDTLKELGITIVDCEEDNAIENQIFKDLDWEYILELIKYVTEEKGEDAVKDLVENQFDGKLPENWNILECDGIRFALAKASTLKKKKKNDEYEDKAWFKRIDHGIFLGEVICKQLDKNKTSPLKTEFQKLHNWINHA